MTQHTLDARRLLCPLPVIRTQQKIKDLSIGDELTIIATDPGVKHDIPTWCRLFGHECFAIEERDGAIFVSVRVGDE